ncbi:hypothetical protein [Bartonella massiliensis]|uniref:hypothetical protein n=1 Tax=Bartonella massiliensis TaxID=929795 RepID=UPI00115A4E87|nr:hypothetical protein [Bartonella massiliensis]
MRRNPQSGSAQIRGKLHRRTICQSRAKLLFTREEGVETERAAPKKRKLQGEETVQTTNSR